MCIRDRSWPAPTRPSATPVSCRTSAWVASPKASTSQACRAKQPPPPNSNPHMFSPPVQRLIDELTKLPGIGPKTAQRLTFHLLRLTPEEALPLANALIEVKETIGFCARCFNLTEQELCSICRDTRREDSSLCVVEEPADVVFMERTREYRGQYHVLGGALSPIDGIGPDQLHMRELLSRVQEGEFLLHSAEELSHMQLVGSNAVYGG